MEIGQEVPITPKPRVAARPPVRVSRTAQIAVKYAILLAVCIVIVAPVVTAVLGSIRTTGQFLARPFGLPTTGIQWQNYTNILESNSFWRAGKNSLIITIGVTFLNVVLASSLAFAFSRVKFLGRELLFNMITLGLLFPLGIATLPIFLQIRSLNLMNSFWGVILPLVAFALPLNVIILRTFFNAIPDELEDAAAIDGCTRISFFARIVLPLARPALATVATLSVIAAWNEYFLCLLILADPKKWPLPLGIMQFQGQYGTDWSPIMAYVTILVVPAVLFYLVTEKYIVTGLTGGELKG
jgi:raffinose/stachyose/melibiose transport system permease protein